MRNLDKIELQNIDGGLIIAPTIYFTKFAAKLIKNISKLF